MANKNPPISRLVFSGGGAKGATYAGAYAAMEETGLFSGVKEIAGSSAGAITAALLATGLSTKDFQETLMNINFSELLGDAYNESWFTKDGAPLYNHIKNILKSVVVTFLKNEQLTESHNCWELLQQLDKQNKPFTFADLEKLRTYWPQRFKQLNITAVKEKGGDLKIFNYIDTPDVEIALACKASGAIPVFLAPVDINGENYIDGGVCDNIPTESFDKCNKTNTYLENTKPHETLVFIFAEDELNQKPTFIQQLFTFVFGGNAVFNALYGSRKNEHDNIQLFINALETVKTILHKKIMDDTHNTPLEELIHQSIFEASKEYEALDKSWLTDLFKIIVSAFIIVWNFICSFISQPTTLNMPEKKIPTQSSYHDIYLKIIEHKLNEAAQHELEQQPDSPCHEKAHSLCNHVKTNMNHDLSKRLHLHGPKKPQVFFDRSRVEKALYWFIPNFFSPFSADYHPADKVEEGYQRVHTTYPLRTVGLKIGNLSAIDFDSATKHARLLSTRGYLDTINTIDNLDLYRKPFDPLQLKKNILKNFKRIYKMILKKSSDPAGTKLLKQLNKKDKSLLSKYYLIKTQAELNMDSKEAFALTRAIELRRDSCVSWDSISEEINQKYGNEKKITKTNSWF